MTVYAAEDYLECEDVSIHVTNGCSNERGHRFSSFVQDSSNNKLHYPIGELRKCNSVRKESTPCASAAGGVRNTDRDKLGSWACKGGKLAKDREHF